MKKLLGIIVAIGTLAGTLQAKTFSLVNRSGSTIVLKTINQELNPFNSALPIEATVSAEKLANGQTKVVKTAIQTSLENDGSKSPIRQQFIVSQGNTKKRLRIRGGDTITVYKGLHLKTNHSRNILGLKKRNKRR